MTTNDTTPIEKFVTVSRASGEVWGLQCKDGWVICDSSIYEDTDVMPFWSSRDAAAIHCVDEWEEFAPVAILIPEFLEEWLVDLAKDAVMLGPDWGSDLSGEEIEAAELIARYLQISLPH
ncbi:DUF2750 domain-containing protein [Enterovibrio makurazakiensis]|uniref:DUF2750 domain-containing protein n=1 Tax=Enterovibrio makurazakiensis TaxID=2910232 RepID=UPI003D233D9D